MDKVDCVVVGAGVIGVAAALVLRHEGHDVILVDRGEPGRATSYGNMAGIGSTEFLPLSYPGVWRRLPRWLLDPAGRERPCQGPTVSLSTSI